MSNQPIIEHCENKRSESKAERLEYNAENKIRADAKPEDRQALSTQHLETRQRDEKTRALTAEEAALKVKRGEIKKAMGTVSRLFGSSPKLIESSKDGSEKVILHGRDEKAVEMLKAVESERISSPLQFNPDKSQGKAFQNAEPKAESAEVESFTDKWRRLALLGESMKQEI